MARHINAACFVRRIRKQGRTYRCCDDDLVLFGVGEPFGLDLTVAVSSSSLIRLLFCSPFCGPLTGTDFTTILLLFPSAKRPDARLDRCVSTLPLILCCCSSVLHLHCIATVLQAIDMSFLCYSRLVYLSRGGLAAARGSDR